MTCINWLTGGRTGSTGSTPSMKDFRPGIVKLLNVENAVNDSVKLSTLHRFMICKVIKIMKATWNTQKNKTTPTS